MQHKYPFTVLHIQVDTEIVDVNVHPTKMEVRFQNQQEMYNCVCEAIARSLRHDELIPQIDLPDPPEMTKTIAQNTAENIEKQSALYKKQSKPDSIGETEKEKQSVLFKKQPESSGQNVQTQRRSRTGNREKIWTIYEK